MSTQAPTSYRIALENGADLSSYSRADIPNEFTARLDYLVWGKSSNLAAYLTDTESGLKYVLSAFSRNGYKPRDSDRSLRDMPTGEIYRVKTRVTRNGNYDLSEMESIN